jgi:hypothetical protein
VSHDPSGVRWIESLRDWCNEALLAVEEGRPLPPPAPRAPEPEDDAPPPVPARAALRLVE